VSQPQIQALNSGDPIWYRRVQRGGYAFSTDVPGTFVKLTPRRAVVRLTKKDGTQVDVAVSRHNVRPRDPERVFRFCAPQAIP
jgi:hypothetical protein